MFFHNYTKPGRGVNKRDPNMPRWKVFWDIFPRKLWDLIKLNLLYLITSLPILIILMVVVGVITNPVINVGSGVMNNGEEDIGNCASDGDNSDVAFVLCDC